MISRSISLAIILLAPAACSPAAETTIPDREILVPEQRVVQDTVTIDQVDAAENAWLVIYNAENGVPNMILGQILIEAGTHTSVKVAIESDQLTELAFVVLHADTGAPGVWEFPSADPLPQVDGRHFMQPFFLEGLITPSDDASQELEQPVQEGSTEEAVAPGEYDY